MDLKVKKERLSLITSELSHIFRKVENVGTVFFVGDGSGCVLRDVVYHRTKSIGLEFEVLSLDDTPYFAGTKEHAAALFAAFGGSYSPSEYCHSMTHHMNLWVWTPPADMQSLSIEDAKDALF